MSPSLPLVGEDFGGYRLRSVLGRGGMSVVFEAENPRLGSVVALKVLAPELAADDLFRTRFLQESRLAASLNHPNVIPIYDTGPCDGLLYIAMRYVAGRDLRTVLKAHEYISPAQALTLVGQAGRALDAAHRHALVHRDVKPANILVERGADDEPDHVYLADFGITKHALSRSGLTATGQLVGTIDYIAPEQIQGKSVDGRADIYSLGCVLYECLTGRVPFLKDLDAAVIWAHVEELPTAPSTLRPELPRGIDDVIARALAKDPNDRYPTAHEFIGAARAALGEPTQSSLSTLSEEGMAPQTVLTGASAPRSSSAPRSMPPSPAVGKVSDTSPELGESHEAPPTLQPLAAGPDDGHGSGIDEPASGAGPPGDRREVVEAPSSGIGDSGRGDETAIALSAQAGETSSERAAAPSKPGHEPLVAQGPGASTPGGQQAGPVPPQATNGGGTGGGTKRRWYAALLVALLAGAVAVVVLASGSSSPAGKLSKSALGPVPTNHVTGSGEATIRLNGNQATVSLTTIGLDNGAELVHLLHIHAGRKGQCPPASAARLHNGHLAISTTDGINYYGPPVQALTTRGDTSASSILAFARFPSGGAIRYTRTFTLPEDVVSAIRRNDAVVVVHGTDYDGTGIYSGVLDPSELNKSVPGTATAPALCGRLVAGQSAQAPSPRSGKRVLVYTASLLDSIAGSVPTRGVFFCHVAEATAALPQTRRQAGTGGAA
jgi:serine/threonine protein kinase